MVRARKRTEPLAGRQRELEKMDMKKDRADPPKYFLALTQNHLKSARVDARQRASTCVNARQRTQNFKEFLVSAKKCFGFTRYPSALRIRRWVQQRISRWVSRSTISG